MSFFIAFGAFLLAAQYLQSVLGLSPFAAGVWTVPSSIGFIIGSLLTPRIVRTVPAAVVMAAGLGLAAIGFGLLTQLGVASGLPVLVIGSVAFSLGLAPVFTLATDLIMGAAPPERAGAASAISETSSEFGGALGIAVLGSISTAVYRSQIADRLPPPVPPDIATVAQDTLGGAMAVVGQLPGQLGAGVLDAARGAFTRGLQLTFAISAAVAIGIAILVIVSRPRTQGIPEPERQQGSSKDGGYCASKVGVVQASRVAAAEAEREP